MTGAFICDRPTYADIKNFMDDYGKKPFFVLVFTDWGKFIDVLIIKDVYYTGCTLLVTWEPWDAQTKKGIDLDALARGADDVYISQFAEKLKSIKGPVFIRFAHEMNGNWYPWAGPGNKEKLIKCYRHIKEVFDRCGASNVKWVYSINWESVPKEGNDPLMYYPGDDYVDYVGIDGYNWGTSQDWSSWMGFREIFSGVYNEVAKRLKKPIIITEFGSASSGGDKTRWIQGAFADIKRMENIKGFIVFNVDKEADWKFGINNAAGAAFREGIGQRYFKDDIKNFE